MLILIPKLIKYPIIKNNPLYLNINFNLTLNNSNINLNIKLPLINNIIIKLSIKKKAIMNYQPIKAKLLITLLKGISLNNFNIYNNN